MRDAASSDPSHDTAVSGKLAGGETTRRCLRSTPSSVERIRLFGSVLVAIALLVAGSVPAHAQGAVSPLANHISPYLRGHAGDPVAWQQWGGEALAQARREDKLVFVSVGYFACHWCHVMQRETFKHPRAAALLNEVSVPVKIDRELRPALDAHLIQFVERTTGRAGWPLNVLLTPEGIPLLGFTYLPTDQFERIVQAITTRWDAEPDVLRDLAERADHQLRAAVSSRRIVLDGPAAAEDLENRLLVQVMAAADPMSGGFGDQAKFPMVSQLLALLRAERAAPDANRRDFLHLTLTQMATQGLRDQIGGGFFRYVTDPTWQVPHYEKMLYDNALLANLYFEAAKVLGVPAYALLAEDTLRFMSADMRDDSGAYIASLSAVDVDDVEGGYYLISERVLEQALPEQADRALAAAAWGLEGVPDTPVGHLALQKAQPAQLAESFGHAVPRVHSELARLRDALADARQSDRLPLDAKLLAGWNGLALSALVRSSNATAGQHARQLAGLLSTAFWRDGELERALTVGLERTGGTRASLQDYAYVARGLLDAALAWDDAGLTAVASDMVERAWADFYQPGPEGGWRLATKDVIGLGWPSAALTDRTMPAPSAVLLDVTYRLLQGARGQADSGNETDAPPVLSERTRGLYLEAIATVDERVLESPFLYASHVGAAKQHFTRVAETKEP